MAAVAAETDAHMSVSQRCSALDGIHIGRRNSDVDDVDLSGQIDPIIQIEAQFREPKVTVRVARMARPRIVPVSAWRPEGRSTATTGRPALLILNGFGIASGYSRGESGPEEGVDEDVTESRKGLRLGGRTESNNRCSPATRTNCLYIVAASWLRSATV